LLLVGIKLPIVTFCAGALGGKFSVVVEVYLETYERPKHLAWPAGPAV